jgi:predicted alpha/beta superfamily hydrolase
MHFRVESKWKERKILLVGVDGGPDRFSDFAGEGADAYARFLKNEFVPFIERKYRCADERAYMGVSLGALFGARLLAQERSHTTYFQYYLLFDGTYQFLGNEDITAEESRFDRSPILKTNIFLTSAWPGNRRSTKLFEERYREREYQGLKLIHKPFDIDHKGIAAPSYSHFVEKIFVDYR